MVSVSTYKAFYFAIIRYKAVMGILWKNKALILGGDSR